MEGEIIIICDRVEKGDLDFTAKGRAKEKCGSCGHEVWISAKTAQLMAQNGAKIVCSVCVPENSLALGEMMGAAFEMFDKFIRETIERDRQRRRKEAQRN